MGKRRSITTRWARRARRRYGVRVLSHKAWGSRHRAVYAWRRRNKPHHVLPGRPVDTLWQHVTVTHDTGTFIGDFREDMQLVERIGMERFGSGVSYNVVWDMERGWAAIGQPFDAKGTHTVMEKLRPGFSYDQNAVALAFAVLGVCGDMLSARAREAISRGIAAAMDVGAVTPDPDYLPHSAAAYKDCPCDETRDAMGQLLRRAKRLHAAKLPPLRPLVTYSRKSRVDRTDSA